MLPGILARRKLFKERLQDRLWAAACWRDYQLASVQRAFEAELAAIDREYDSEQTNLKDKLLGELLEERKMLLEGREGPPATKESTRILQSHRAPFPFDIYCSLLIVLLCRGGGLSR